MKCAPFHHHAPESVDDAIALLHAHGDEAKALAGGQSLVPMLALRLTRFGHIVDLNAIAELRGIRDDGSVLRIGAMTRQATLVRDGTVARCAPLLTEATRLIGHFQIRNRGTIGGSVAHADPAAELPAALLALDATLVTRSPHGDRRIPAGEFFTGTWSTVLDADELLVAIEFPVGSASVGTRVGFAVDEVARRAGDFALAGCAARVHITDGRLVNCAIALFGVASVPVRAGAAEAALHGLEPAGIDLEAVSEAALDGLPMATDIHADADLRQHLGRTVVRRALARALARAAAEPTDVESSAGAKNPADVEEPIEKEQS